MDVASVVAYVATHRPIRGRKALQKLLYFASELGLPLRVSFKMYLYGPYSHEVAQEYDRLLFEEILVEKNQGLFGAGPQCERYLEAHRREVEANRMLLDRLIELFGELSPLDLEMYATVHFVAKSLERAYGGADMTRVIAEVQAAKGDKFARANLERAYADLQRWDLLPPDTGQR